MPDSDTDIRCIFIPPIDYFLGTKVCNEFVDSTQEDTEYWNIDKFVSLCMKGNPSALNILFANKKDILEKNEYGDRLLEFRETFLSRRVIKATVGYCLSQIHKMNVGRGSKEGKRALLIEKYGYDTKFAYHAVMMTNMAIELIKTSSFNPLRKSSEQTYLKEIRLGKIPLDIVLEKINYNLKVIKVIEPSNCELPDIPNEKKINDFKVDLLTDFFRKEFSYGTTTTSP